MAKKGSGGKSAGERAVKAQIANHESFEKSGNSNDRMSQTKENLKESLGPDKSKENKK